MIKHKCLYEAPKAEIATLLVRAGMLYDVSYGQEGAAGADTDDENYGDF